MINQVRYEYLFTLYTSNALQNQEKGRTTKSDTHYGGRALPSGLQQDGDGRVAEHDKVASRLYDGYISDIAATQKVNDATNPIIEGQSLSDKFNSDPSDEVKLFEGQQHQKQHQHQRQQKRQSSDPKQDQIPSLIDTMEPTSIAYKGDHGFPPGQWHEPVMVASVVAVTDSDDDLSIFGARSKDASDFQPVSII